MRGASVLGMAAAVVFCAARAASAEVRTLVLKPVDDAFWSRFEAAPLDPAPATQPRSLVACGRVEDPAFAVDSLDRVRVVDADGGPVPLTIDRRSIVREFGRIVAFDFQFRAAEGPSGSYRLEWGQAVSGQATEVDRLTVDPSRRELYRVAVVEAPAAGAGGEGSVATIEIIADSKANYYFLAYLLPMAVLLGVLGVRKAASARS